MSNVKSSSVKRTDKPPISAGAREPVPLALYDQDALDALDFAQRGRPDTEVGYSEDAPRLTSKQLAEFEPASFGFANRK